jgi:predicted DNA-binding transcriptional regulator
MRSFSLVYISKKPVSNEDKVFERVNLKTLIYYGLTHFDEVPKHFLELGIEALCYGFISIPRDICFNKFKDNFNYNIRTMKKLNLIELHKGYSKKDHNTLKILYKRIKQAEIELPRESEKSQSRIIGEKKIIETLYSVCEKVYNGWKENPILNQFIEEKDIKIPDKFILKLLPKNVIVSGYHGFPLVILILGKNRKNPMSIEEISNKTGISESFVRRIVYVINRYGILKKEENGYTLSDDSIYKDAYSEMEKRINNLRKNVELDHLLEKRESVYEIHKKLNISIPTIYLRKKGVKPRMLNNKILDLLREIGMITDEDITLFEREGLIWWDFRSST